MTHDSGAPWAEPVPEAGMPMTVDELARLPDDACRYELVEGRLVRMSPTGGRHGRISLRLGAVLNSFVEAHGLGCVTGAETGFLLSRPGEPETVLAPDVAFVRAEHVPPENSPEYDTFWHLVPDVVAEVASPSQYRSELAEKARLWLAYGACLVWVVWPQTKQVEVWRPGRDMPMTILGIADMLDVLDVVPGFMYTVASLLA
jgi:Uma2 family endonuclease